MQTRTQRQGSFGPQASRGVTDWHALEVQLNRTRTILQEILLHLQEVLRNLKSVRGQAGGFGTTSRAEAGSRTRESRFTATAGPRFRAQTVHQTQSGRDSSQNAATGGAQGASDRFRAKPRSSVFETRANAGAQARTGAANEKARAETTWSSRPGPSGSRTAGQTGTAGRERPRAESTWRTKTAGQGAERETRASQSASAQRPSARPTARPRGFHMDSDRQHRAREVARKCGMNLKCAYDILCLDYPCTSDEIKVAYRHMARLHHPDLGGDEEAMKDVNVAYELAMRFCAGPRRASTAWAV